MSKEKIKELVWEVAAQSAGKGPGWSQEGVVLREIGDRIARRPDDQMDLQMQQMVLDAWHDLFIEQRLGWGYNLDNPNSPFFHIR